MNHRKVDVRGGRCPVIRAKTAMRLGSFVQNLLSPPRLILAYHHVAELSTDPWGLAVSPSNFSAQLDVLRAEYKPVSLFSLVDTGFRTHPANTVAITFDDGYADNLLTAKPLLERVGIPATFFVTVGGIDAKTEFWWDALERIILQTESLPARLTLPTKNGSSEWFTGEEDGSEGHSLNPEADFHATGRFKNQVSTTRNHLYQQLWELLIRASPTERAQFMQQLHDWSGVPMEARESHRTLTREELVQLHKGDRIDVGAHSVTHTPLTQLDHESQREEIVRSKQFLDQLLGPQRFGFAYPHGRHDESTRELVAHSGYAFACTTQDGMVYRSTPRFQLPRCTVLNWNDDEFREQLQGWQTDLQK